MCSAVSCFGAAAAAACGTPRTHYSLGQIHALQQQWQQSQDGYSACAALSTDPQARAQALYCAGVACHQQGRHKEALQAFQQAAAAGPPSSLQAMLVLGSARALQGMGQPDEAAAAARQFLAGEHAQVCPQPVAEALRSLAAGAPCGSSSEAQAGGA
jgi:tetratricopeptide (TPR) repeat protein